VLGVARRLPPDPAGALGVSKVSWHAADIGTDPLDMVAGADVVVALAWKIQPSRDEEEMRNTNVVGTRRVAEAVAAHDVPALVYASSVGAYAPHPKQGRADETWPATGIDSSTYSRHKAEVEAVLDRFQSEHPGIRVVRMRTSLVFQRGAASEVHRLFFGRLLPWHLPRLLRWVPDVATLQFQAAHADDIAAAYLAAITSDVEGPFNVAAEPVLTPQVISALVEGRTLPMPEGVLRAAASLAYWTRLQPSEPGWLDMATKTPLMDTTRARERLGWRPRRSSIDALRELLDGIGEGAGDETVPLQPR
jgi:nucleoside-diphosphate-sugar epimerase